MRTYNLLARNLRWYWRTNLAVALGVATAAGVLGGAALVGESVRASLRAIALGRLGKVDTVISRNGFVREELTSAFPGSAPVIALEAAVSREQENRRISGVQVYGVDERFWRLQGLQGGPPAGRDAILTTALAAELEARPGDAVLLRAPKPSAIPLESLHGRKDQAGKTIRLTVAASSGLEFSLQPRQSELKAMYVPLARLQRDLEQPGKVNTILLGRPAALGTSFTLADLGITLRDLPEPAAISVETDSALISDKLAQTVTATAQALGVHAQPVLTYLANSIGVECAPGRTCPTVPYSVVTALDSELAPAAEDGIVLNDWTARSLNARPGDTVSLEYFVWRTEGRLSAPSARFRVERIVPIEGAAADRNFAPKYPGITESESVSEWDPPFPLDLKRVRPEDEAYWKRYRATPKAFIRLERGRQLWGTRFGSLTSIRISPPDPAFGARLRAAVDPAAMGLSAVSVRGVAVSAAAGATDFGEYFLYFSFFLVVSALLLTGLFFRLGIEQRSREIGILQSLGFSMGKIRTLFLVEGAVLALAGSALGIGAALGYGALILLGLRTWWIGAVGTQMLTVHASPAPLAMGAAAGVLTGLAAVGFTLRAMKASTPRGLVAGQQQQRSGRWRRIAACAAALAAIALGAASAAGKVSETAGFFGAGTLLLTAAMLFLSSWLRTGRLATVASIPTLGLRSLAHRPGRSVLCITLIATSTFTIVSLDAFRREGSARGAGGYPLVATSDVPLIQDPETSPGTEIVSFRVKPGDDASCLNLYRPLNPRILAPPPAFLRQTGFDFQDAARETPNPWTLIEEKLADGVIPVIADANSMTYSMRLKLGEEFALNGVRYKIVAALRDSIFQGELLISETNFLRLFPDIQGRRFFLIKTRPVDAVQVARGLEDSLSDYGFDAQDSAAILAGFHHVENTYLSTFRALGGLGLILGTVGLAAILLRNVLERRRELALLRAVGFRPEHLAAIVLIENAALLVTGLGVGAACALPAVLPAVSARGGHVPLASVGSLLAIVLLTGIVASLGATAVALRSPLLETLKGE